MDLPEPKDAAADDPLNRRISIIVALSATFLAIGNVKDGNINQAMQQAQADAVDHWGYYQAKSTKLHVAEAAVADLTAIATTLTSPEQKAVVDPLLAHWKGEVEKFAADKKEVEAKAREAQGRYDALNFRDDQFDISEAAISLAIALLGITALTRQRWLLALGSVFAGFGVLMEVAGFAGWHLHPDVLAKLLS